MSEPITTMIGGLIYRLKVETCENKRKKFKNKNCERAKTRAAVSYDTLVVLYHQLFDLSRLSPAIESQITKYKKFLTSVSHFLGEAKSCEYNPQWNPLIIKVFLTKHGDIFIGNILEKIE